MEKDLSMCPTLVENSFNDRRGFSVVELLIVVAMIAVISGFALLQITRSHQEMKRANAAQQFASHLEKARLDSVRRRPTSSAQMGQVSIINARFYSFAADSNGDGSLDAPQVVSLPTNTDFQFNGPFPRTIYFNWRGRTVDAAGAPVDNPTVVTISSPSSPSYGSSQIDLTAGGQPSLEGPPVSSPVTNSDPPAPNFRANTQIP
jgi:prepilin-type N-terminal cleavage/methylation domain-containing protein